MARKFFSQCLLALFYWAALMQSGSSGPKQVLEYPTPSIREQQEVVVDGVPEQWRLEWKGRTKPYCGADEASAAITCPCQGFAYGESGDLYIVRLRDGKEIDRLHLTPLFEDEETAVVQRWPQNDKTDFNPEKPEKEDITKLVSKRPIVQVMQLEDYNHDGKRTEFYLQTEAVPCGRSVGVIVGITANRPRLHVFGTAENPAKPLYLQKHEWKTLREASSSSVDVLDWPCGDHGADTQTWVYLQWSAKGIDGKRREYTCPSDHKAKKLIKESPLWTRNQ